MDIFAEPKMMPIYLLDYTYVIMIYFSIGFILALVIDNYVLPHYSQEITNKTDTHILYFEVFIQIALQGFMAILLYNLLLDIRSPLEGVWGYDTKTPVGKMLRNPAIISVTLLGFSKSLQGRMLSLFARYDVNAKQLIK